ncbi:MAG: endolytic transglycosylase MltG [Lachnoclostridium sp.]|nr:endolytic transglycosylase MltG [Lachnoclostridium sp.]
MNDKTSSKKKSAAKKKTPDTFWRRNSLAILITAIALPVVVICFLFLFALNSYSGEDTMLYIPASATQAQVKDSLKTRLGSSDGTRVYLLWRMSGGKPEVAHGAYNLEHGRSALSIARQLKNGRQTPVKVTFPAVRTMDNLAERVTRNLEITPEEFLEACRKVLPDSGFRAEQFPAAFLPDTYEFYWTSSGETVVKRLLEYRNRFWTADRIARARSLGLSKVDVATLASIVEEETAKRDERPLVARLYLNRLKKKMRLQADPTVKFATGDFTLRRIGAEHLAINSPYNTYKVNGLPPGPIRVPEALTLDAVLNAPEHPYIYMCAKADFSGYHDFEVDYQAHVANARRYQAELNRRGIKK